MPVTRGRTVAFVLLAQQTRSRQRLALRRAPLARPTLELLVRLPPLPLLLAQQMQDTQALTAARLLHVQQTRSRQRLALLNALAVRPTLVPAARLAQQQRAGVWPMQGTLGVAAV